MWNATLIHGEKPQKVISASCFPVLASKLDVAWGHDIARAAEEKFSEGATRFSIPVWRDVDINIEKTED